MTVRAGLVTERICIKSSLWLILGCEYDCVRADDDYNSTCVKTKSEAVHFNVGDCLYTPYYQFAWQLVGIIAISLWALGCKNTFDIT